MDKILRWIGENVLFVCTLLLLILIPLYPKLPLLDIENTWVYVRVEDFVVVFVLLLWVGLLYLKKVSLKTPLTVPIMVFWIVGAVATLHGVFLLFSTFDAVHANVAFLSYLRRIEYMSLFFVAYAGIKDKRSMYYVIFVLTVVLLLIVGYGFGQRFLGFPAFLTMNEEFAKGIPIQLGAFSRISSTFAGHYDLAAYLVLIIPILTSLVFGFKNIFIKLVLLATSLLGFVLLFMTISRVSFVVLLVALGIVFMFQKKRLVIISAGVLMVMLLVFSQPLLARFGSTVSEVEVLVHAKTGVAIGPVKQVQKTYFEDILITIKEHNQSQQSSSISAIFPYSHVPETAALVVEPNRAAGEDLSQGTSYINLSLSPVTKKVKLYFFEKTNTASKEADVYFGEFVIKKAKAYDLSATTRFQGEWPRTLEAFRKNIFLGSGYGAVSLAVDNNYLRILGETGLFGLLSFLSIFIFAGIYIKKTLPKVDSPIIRTFVLGFVAGSVGLALNAVLIDVFEASKIAFTYWLLMGITLGMLHVYTKEEIDLFAEFKKVLTSTYAIGIYLLVIIIGLFSSLYTNYFVSMDYTWLRLASDCSGGRCEAIYRPATLLYFQLMHSVFWLNQTAYHIVSLSVYFAVAVVLFLLLKHIFKNIVLPTLSTAFFLLLAGHAEVVLWISSIDILFATFFALLSVLFFVYWEEQKKRVFFFLSLVFAIIAPFFHESALVTPFLVVLYGMVFKSSSKNHLFFYSTPLFIYVLSRFIATGQVFSGTYNFLMVPINIIGYILLGVLGLGGFSITSMLFIPFTLIVLFGIVGFYYMVMRYLPMHERRIVIFGFTFFLLAALPFLGKQTLHFQYGYLPNVGLVILLSLFVKQIYEYLKQTQDTFIAAAGISIFILIFSMLQVFQIQTLERNWREVSKKSEQFLISFGDHYSDEWKEGQWNFYFVAVPDAPGEPWVEPSSLVDAIWFVTQNPKTQILIEEKLSRALDSADTHANTRVFEFQGDGSVKSVIRKTVKGKTVIIKE